MESAFIDIFDSLLPAMLVSTDSVMAYYNKRSHTVNFYFNIIKAVISLTLLLYICYLYYYKKQKVRISNNYTDIVLLSVTLIIIGIAIYYSYLNMKAEKNK